MNDALVKRSELTEAQLDEMFALLGRHFVNVPREQFLEDLEQKNWAILLRDPDSGELQGFSVLHLYDAEYHGATVSVIFSGDTIVSPEAWRRSSLPRMWIGSVNHLRRRHSKGQLYWFLLCSGFRTYRFLPVFWRDFYPRHDAPTPQPIQDLIDSLATERFGERYHRGTGVVHLERPQVLHPDLRGIPESRLDDPHVAFFARKNPGHEEGQELACFTELSWENLTPAGRRMWKAGEREFAARQEQGER